jgi:hypothetical protein
MFGLHQQAVSAASIQNEEQSGEKFLKQNINVLRGIWTRMKVL